MKPGGLQGMLQSNRISEIAKKLVKLGSPAIESLFQFVAAKASSPEWLTKKAESQFTIHSPRTKMFEVHFEPIVEGLEKSKQNEIRLWHLFDQATATNQRSKHWGDLPAIVAFGIQTMYDKYTYWVIRGDENSIESLDEIMEQRKKLAPKEAQK